MSILRKALAKKILNERVIYKEKYFDKETRKNKTKNVDGVIVGYDEKTDNYLIKTDEGIVQRNNFYYAKRKRKTK